MLRWEIDIVHLVGEQHVLTRLLKRNAPCEFQFAGWSLRIVDSAVVRPFENDLARTRLDACAFQQDRQWHAGPFRVTHGAESPLDPFHFRLEKIAIVSGTLERDVKFARFDS